MPSARVVVITGLQGSGKTTVAEQLRARHGFVHFDGDLWASGADPVAGDYKTKLGEQKVPGMNPEHKERFAKFCNFLVQLRTAAEHGENDNQDPASTTTATDVAEPEWQPFLAAFCEAVQRCRESLPANSPGLLVSYSLYLQSMREFLRRSLGGENTCVLVLQVPSEVAVERAAKRCAEQYAQMGKTVEEWKAMLGPNQTGYEAANEAPADGILVLNDDGSLDCAQVVAKAEAALGLTEKPAVSPDDTVALRN